MVTRNGRFQVSKGYSREAIKRDTDRFVEEDFYRDQALRRLEERRLILPRLADRDRRTQTAPAPVRRFEPPVTPPRPAPVETPLRLVHEPGATAPPPNTSERREPTRLPKLRRQKLRLRHTSQPGWWVGLLRRLFGRR